MRLRLRPKIRWSEGCNLSCSFCYQTGRHRPEGVMRYDVLLRILEELRDTCYAPVKLTWSGGEPTVPGLDRFRHAAGLADAVLGPGQVHHTLETNGVLLDRDWVRFLTESRFSVLLSLDGPELIHESHRRGSHRQAVEALKLLGEADVPVEVVGLVTPVTLAAADVLLEYFQRLGVKVLDLIPAYRFAGGRPVPFVTPAEYGRFLCRLLDSWHALEEPRLRVRPLEAVGRQIVRRPSLSCRSGGNCFRYLTFTATGDVYPCDVFSALEGYRLGNVMERPLTALVRRDLFGSWPSECARCKWQSICLGGCPLEQLAGGDRPFFCEAWKVLFEHVFEVCGSVLECERAADMLRWVGREASEN